MGKEIDDIFFEWLYDISQHFIVLDQEEATFFSCKTFF